MQPPRKALTRYNAKNRDPDLEDLAVALYFLGAGHVSLCDFMCAVAGLPSARKGSGGEGQSGFRISCLSQPSPIQCNVIKSCLQILVLSVRIDLPLAIGSDSLASNAWWGAKSRLTYQRPVIPCRSLC